MTLGTREEGLQEILETETYAFPRSEFPLELFGHKIQILKNKFYERSDGKLRVKLHLNCECIYCIESKIEGTIDMVTYDRRQMILLYPLHRFAEKDCQRH